MVPSGLSSEAVHNSISHQKKGMKVPQFQACAVTLNMELSEPQTFLNCLSSYQFIPLPRYREHEQNLTLILAKAVYQLRQKLVLCLVFTLHVV